MTGWFYANYEPPDRAELAAEARERCAEYGHDLRREHDTGAVIPVCVPCRTDLEALADRIANEGCDVGHDTDCPWCPGCCPCLGYCYERAAVIDSDGDELLSDARRDAS